MATKIDAQNCDFCKKPLRSGSCFYDAATRQGPWAFMCWRCFMANGIGVGPGVGQKYDSKTDEKIEG